MKITAVTSLIIAYEWSSTRDFWIKYRKWSCTCGFIHGVSAKTVSVKREMKTMTPHFRLCQSHFLLFPSRFLCWNAFILLAIILHLTEKISAAQWKRREYKRGHFIGMPSKESERTSHVVYAYWKINPLGLDRAVSNSRNYIFYICT